MPRGTFLRRASALIPALVLGAGLAFVSAPAGADTTGTAGVPLTDPANGGTCPQAESVVVSGVSGQSQLFLVVPPGPAGCPAGLDVAVNADPAGGAAGEAVTLPLTSSSCQEATALIESEITALGQNPSGIGSGPSAGGSSACPAGEAVATELLSTFNFVSRLLEGFGIYYFFNHGATKHTLVLAGAPGVFALTGIFDIAVSDGSPEGAFTLGLAGSIPVLYVLHPSGTPGVSTIGCAFCSS